MIGDSILLVRNMRIRMTMNDHEPTHICDYIIPGVSIWGSSNR